MDRSHFFHEYNMEGVTPKEPEIYLELEPDRLVKTLNALRSAASSARSLKVPRTRYFALIPVYIFHFQNIAPLFR